MRISWRPIQITSDLWVKVSFILISAQLLDLCTTFHLVHRACTSHKTSTNGSNTMPMHRDTTYGILSQLHLATTSKMTDEVMPFLKLLLDSGPAMYTSVWPVDDLSFRVCWLKRYTEVLGFHTSILTEPFYYYRLICTCMYKWSK